MINSYGCAPAFVPLRRASARKEVFYMMWGYMMNNYGGFGISWLFWLNGILTTLILVLIIAALWKYISKK